MNSIKKYFLLSALCLFPVFGFCQTSKFSLEDDNIWVVQMFLPELGKFDFYASFEQKGSLTLIKSIENRDTYILGNFKARLIRTFQKRKYKESLVALEIKNKNGEIHSLLGIFPVKDVAVYKDSIVGLIYNTKGSKRAGQFVCRKILNDKKVYSVMNNYPAICEKMINTALTNMYNLKITKTADWRDFCKNMKEKSSKVYDDLEFLLLFFANIRNTDFSRFVLVKMNNLERIFNDPQITVNKINESAVLFKVKTFSGRISEIDSIFNIYGNYKIKILDLRDTQGGSLKNMFAFASHLLCDTVSAGAFVTRNCRQNINELHQLQKNETDDFQRILSEKKGVRITLYPSAQNKNPKNETVCILTGKRTASVCEPLIYALKKRSNVRIAGENTAGAASSQAIFDLGNEYFLIIPVADYLTDDGKSLEKTGIAPYAKVKADKALSHILKELKINQ